MKVIKRDGRTIDFDRQKIQVAIEKANREVRGKEKATKDDINEIIKYIEKYYSDSTCGTEIASGTAYEPNKFYHLAIVDEFSNDTSVVLSESIANDATSFISQVKWTVNLTGGSHDDVVSAINGDKKIGTVTVTLSAPTNNN